ncbi:MAG: DinB family protein [Chloroflexi bacterium]|nr:DinB family protein [Chloroflexota bacterium]OJV92492.1 MAG: hypothetical protein BGO39_31745 [Chloroflexi bacterium 54-19]
MTAAILVQQRIFESWQYYQNELKRVVAPLTEEQLKLRAVPGQRSLGELASHIVYARAKWLLSALPEGDTALEQFLAWQDPGEALPSAAEIVWGLDLTWQRINTSIEGWAQYSPDTQLTEKEVTGLRTIWGLLEHDLHHGGELAFSLGALGLPAPEM